MTLYIYFTTRVFNFTFVEILSASQEPKHSDLAMTAAFSRVLRTHILPLKGRHGRQFSVARTASRYVARGTLAGVVVPQQQIQDDVYIYIYIFFFFIYFRPMVALCCML